MKEEIRCESCGRTEKQTKLYVNMDDPSIVCCRDHFKGFFIIGEDPK